MEFFKDKRVLVFGIANERSIAWSITEAMHKQGARFCLTFAGEALEKRVRPLGENIMAEMVLPCDVTDDAQIEAVFAEVDRTWGGIDVLIHAVAFANREDLDGRYVDTSRAGFKMALDISAYSLVVLSRHTATHKKPKDNSNNTLSYY